MALVTHAEREAISSRATEALAVAKPRGVKQENSSALESLSQAGNDGAALRAAVSGGGSRRSLGPGTRGYPRRRAHVATRKCDGADGPKKA